MKLSLYEIYDPSTKSEDSKFVIFNYQTDQSIDVQLPKGYDQWHNVNNTVNTDDITKILTKILPEI